VTSPIRQNLFERECDMPLLEKRHLALLLLGLDASQPANALPEEHQENYRILHDAISRTIKATGMVSAPANKRMSMPSELFVWLGVAAGVKALGLPVTSLALRYIAAAMLIGLIRGIITEYLFLLLSKRGNAP